MRQAKLVPLLMVLLLQAAAHAQTGGWKDRSGKPIAETESMKSVDGFGGSLVATTDEDWQQKWNTPPESTPHFTKAETVPYGKKVFFLIFVSNPKPDAAGRASVTCGLKILSPSGTPVLDQPDMQCFDGKVQNQHHLYLSAPVVAFAGDAGDPEGRWVAEVVLKDGGRSKPLQLRTSFMLRGSNG